MRRYEIMATIACLALIVGVPVAFFVDDKSPVVKTESQFVEYYVGGAQVREFQLMDGTRCVLTYAGRAITCEWRQPVVLVPQVQ